MFSNFVSFYVLLRHRPLADVRKFSLADWGKSILLSIEEFHVFFRLITASLSERLYTTVPNSLIVMSRIVSLIIMIIFIFSVVKLSLFKINEN